MGTFLQGVINYNSPEGTVIPGTEEACYTWQRPSCYSQLPMRRQNSRHPLHSSNTESSPGRQSDSRSPACQSSLCQSKILRGHLRSHIQREGRSIWLTVQILAVKVSHHRTPQVLGKPGWLVHGFPHGSPNYFPHPVI